MYIYIYIYIYIHTYTRYVYGGHMANKYLQCTLYAYCSVGWFAGVAFRPNSCSQSFPNVYIHRAVGVQDRTCASGRLPMRDLLSAPWMVKYAQNPGGSKCSPLLPPADAHGLTAK